ncbi:FAD:protein FMN transferase [Luteibaculum oceani]|nr:FAD:protein FMN transferase [Luteibaculum oceani]
MTLEVNHKIKKALPIGGAFFCFLLCLACGDLTNQKQEIRGYAQGTTYNISFYGNASKSELQSGIDSMLLRMDHALSNYKASSQIFQLNQSTDTIYTLEDSCGFWKRVWLVSKEVHQKSKGAFDPSIYPLVKTYGFGPNQKPSIDSTANIDSLKALVGFENWSASWKDGKSFTLQKPLGAQLDFNAVAQGMAVDLISEFLESNNIKSYFVELGGEVRVGEPKPGNLPWVLGIETPNNTTERTLSDTLQIKNISVATSGSNRKYYEQDGKRYSHAINAKTAAPVSHNVLSVTIKHKSCAYADAWATAALVLGEESKVLLEEESIGFIFQ